MLLRVLIIKCMCENTQTYLVQTVSGFHAMSVITKSISLAYNEIKNI